MFEITLLLEILALITGVIFFKKITPVILKLLVPLLLVIVVNETVSHYIGYSKLGLNKSLVYNLFFCLFFIVFAMIFKPKWSGKNTWKQLVFSAPFIIVAGLLFYQQGYNKLNVNFITSINLFLIVFATIYLYTIYKSNEVVALKKDSLFVVAIGLIMSQFLLLLFINALRVDGFKTDANMLGIFKTFNTIGNIFFYLCIIYSFICTSIYHRQAGI